MGHVMFKRLVSPLVILLALALAAGGCAGTEESGEPFGEHDEPADYEPVPGDGKADGLDTFNQNHVYTDVLLKDSLAIDVAGVQRFFEATPYGNRSWLADATINGVSAAQAVVNAAVAEGINPLVLVARMQVESSLVSKSVAPSKYRQDKALGCGCPDGGGCSDAYKGLDKQLVCAAKILNKWYAASMNGTGEYRVGKSTRTLDPRTVTPQTHATASLYAYTPWVLVGRGGTWLVWNVTRKYVRHAVAEGLLTPTN